ncbi:MAG TPA: hypothetical protein VEC35_08025 [Noviherbaspirillum sp.]|nr:hypothetical protein [Noviherbaspirillum sp.]
MTSSIRPLEVVGILLLMLLSCSGLYLFLFPSPPGYCSTQTRFLTDDEYIVRALRIEQGLGDMDLSRVEDSIERFIKENPGCCSVARPKQPSVYERLFNNQVKLLGTEPVTVHLIYEVNDGRKKLSKRHP